jgi:hypothetical protein
LHHFLSVFGEPGYVLVCGGGFGLHIVESLKLKVQSLKFKAESSKLKEFFEVCLTLIPP